MDSRLVVTRRKRERREVDRNKMGKGKAKRPPWKLQRPLGGLGQRRSGQDVSWVRRLMQGHPCLQSHVTVPVRRAGRVWWLLVDK